ncbi:hypothetical protein DL767_006584 [Monosporascus sp. MG133]|nr:hypothetical protein DL767_006584 [Monosporascus sp. MG133]
MPSASTADCYEEYVRGSGYQSEFKGAVLRDGRHRACRYGKPRIKDDLFKSALDTRTLDAVIRFMELRSYFPDCTGRNGVKGTAAIRCDLAANFEPTHTQPVEEAWPCDLAAPYTRKEYSVRAAEDDWGVLRPRSLCPHILAHMLQEKTVYPEGQKWFTPTNGPQGFLGSEPIYAQEGRPAGSHLWICSFNPAIPPYSMYMVNHLRMIYTKDPGLLERFANEYAYIPPCRRATHLDNARCFGWEQCTICPEFDHTFAWATALAGSMPPRGAQIARFRNQLEGAGAQYGAQAVAVAAGAVWLEIETLEGRWREIE